MLVIRSLTAVLLFSYAVPLTAQDAREDAALNFSRSMSIPLNAVHLFDKALEAWTWTFGQEPGASLKRSDRSGGIIEGTARVNFRSEMLTGREESMGVIQYRVTIMIHAGECRLTVSELTHIGNRSAPRGGIHCGLLTRGLDPTVRVPGLGHGNVQRLYADLKSVSSTRITAVMQSFEARLRASAEP